MIRLNNKEIGSVEIGRKAVSKVMQGTHLIGKWSRAALVLVFGKAKING